MPTIDQWRERCSACGSSIPFSLQVRQIHEGAAGDKRTDEPAATREQQLADDLLAEVRHQRDQLERQVEALQRQLDDATVERAQLMALVGYLLSRGLLRPGRDGESPARATGATPRSAVIDVDVTVR
jgi:hypothetical protein